MKKEEPALIELLASNLPPLKTKKKKFTQVFYENMGLADKVIIASGCISVSSITELTRILELNNKPRLELIAGMHYFEGFSIPQFQAIQKLNKLLDQNKLGNIYLASVSKYHGKCYSFLNNNDPIAGILGSSNLSAITTTERQYESDILSKDPAFNNELLNFITELLNGVKKYFEFYNSKRFHQSLNYQTPDEMHQAFIVDEEEVKKAA
ncbi:NgoFVII family restriction endonuclease [candidate division KSB1 bacterium]|nr:NgoFVII family restriction endonuclease [candidate division KSB1 bacterium]